MVTRMFETSAEPASASTSGTDRRVATRKRVAIGAIAVLLVAGGVLAGLVATRGKAAAAAVGPTMAGSPPAMTAGRGAPVPFIEQEAAGAKTNGTVLAESRAWDTLAGEAVGRRAVTLHGQGKYVEFTLTQPANAID